MENRRADEHLVDLWFRLRDQMMKTMAAQPANAIRPPSLRDAAYAYVLASRNANETSEETIEAYVNGLELGAIGALRMAWELRKKAMQAGEVIMRNEELRNG